MRNDLTLSLLFYPFLLILREIEFHSVLEVIICAPLQRKVFEFIRLCESAIEVYRKINDLSALCKLGVILRVVIHGIMNNFLLYL